MSERVFKFRLAELGTVRIVCAKCRAAAEVTIDQLATRFSDDPVCVGCNHHLGIARGAGNPVTRLAVAIRDYITLKANSEQPLADIEFVLPDNGTTKLDPRSTPLAR
jgi:hypothetical protein